MSLESAFPSRHVFSTPISAADASRIMDSYLDNSIHFAHLHPDALITPTEVRFSSRSGSTGGVVIHNLRRIAAGMKGDFWEPETTPEADEDGMNGIDENVEMPRRKRQRPLTQGIDWQDKTDYEREQGGTEVGEIGNRINAAPVQAAISRTEIDEYMHQGSLDVEIDKEARKSAKKARRKQERSGKHNNISHDAV